VERVIVYIDGFNLYFGLKSKKWQKFLWLDLRELSLQLLKPQQTLRFTKYFTAKVTHNPAKEKRQKIFLEALETLPDFNIFYGKYQINKRRCNNCNYVDDVPSEKMTDVNIAVEMLSDAYQDKFDTAILVSADGDLVPAIRAVKHLFPHKRIVAAFPPDRDSFEIRDSVDGYFRVGRGIFARSQFAKKVRKCNGYILQRPSKWR
jgi:hypothetical protein